MFIPLEVGKDGIGSMQIKIDGVLGNYNKYKLPISSKLSYKHDNVLRFDICGITSIHTYVYWIIIQFDTKDSVSKWIEKYNYSKLFDQDKEMKGEIRELKDKVQELIDMITYLPSVGPGYHEAKNDFQKQCEDQLDK